MYQYRWFYIKKYIKWDEKDTEAAIESALFIVNLGFSGISLSKTFAGMEGGVSLRS